MEKTQLKNINYKELFSESIKIFKTNWSVMILGFIALVVSILAINSLGTVIVNLSDGLMAIAILINILTWLFEVLISIGFVNLALRVSRGETSSIKDIYFAFNSKFPILNYVLLSIMVSVLVILGYFLLIIPGIILTAGLLFANYLFIDQKKGIQASLEKSWEITKGYKLKILGLLILILLLNILGLLSIVVGLLITLPLTQIILTVLYFKLTNTTETINHVDIDNTNNETKVEQKDFVEDSEATPSDTKDIDEGKTDTLK